MKKNAINNTSDLIRANVNHGVKTTAGIDVQENMNRLDKAKTGAENAINSLTSIKLDLLEAGPGFSKEITQIQDMFYEGHRKLQNFEGKLRKILKKAAAKRTPDEIRRG